MSVTEGCSNPPPLHIFISQHPTVIPMDALAHDDTCSKLVETECGPAVEVFQTNIKLSSSAIKLGRYSLSPRNLNV
jgi:hypothetical protein